VALAAFREIESNVIKLRGAQRTNRVRLHQALGGSFDAAPLTLTSARSITRQMEKETTMKMGYVSIAVAALAAATAAWAQVLQEGPVLVAQGMSQDQKAQQDLKGMEKAGQRDDMQSMTAAQQAQYKTEYQAAKAKWASLTPQQKSATIAAARSKKLSELSAMELVGQRDDMQSETAAQTAQMKAEADAAKVKWDKLTPSEKQALRKSAWQRSGQTSLGWRRWASETTVTCCRSSFPRTLEQGERKAFVFGESLHSSKGQCCPMGDRVPFQGKVK